MNSSCNGTECAGPPPRPGPPPALPEWAIITIMTSISFFAIIGNILAIFCFLKFRRKLKQNIVAYLISLAVSDLWIGMMMGLGIVSKVEHRWVFGEFLCQVTGFLNNVALVNSLWTVALGSIDRCFAIRVPFKHRSIMTKRRLVTLIIGTWCYAALLSMPPLFRIPSIGYYTFSPAHPWCAMSPKNKLTYFLVFFLGFLPLPLVIILTSYIVIFITTKGYTRRQLDRLSSTGAWSRMADGGEAEDTVKSSLESPGTRSSSEYTPCSGGGGGGTMDKMKKHTSWNPQLTTTIDQPPFYKKVLWYSFDHVKEVLCGRGEKKVLTRKSSLMSEEEAAARKLRKQAGTLLIVIGATILLSYTPMLSISTLAAFKYRVKVQYKEVQGFTFLMLSNAAINPLIYFLLNKEFRMAALSLFGVSPGKFMRQVSRTASVPLTSTLSRASHVGISQTLSYSDHGGSRPSSLNTGHGGGGVLHEMKRMASHAEISVGEAPPHYSSRGRAAAATTRTNSLQPSYNSSSRKTAAAAAPTRPRSVPYSAEDPISRHVLRNSILLTDDKGGKKGARRGLVNLSFYEVESTI